MSEPISPNSTLAHYRIVSKLGAGAMGEVYLAQDTKLDRRVALKILPEAFAADADRMRRFGLEAKSASALNHPNIITIYEIGEASIQGINFIATEFIEGTTLNNFMSMPLTTALDVATQIVSALQAAHSAGIIHRDIKPENVIIRPDGLVKILDFGIAKMSGPPVIAGGVNSGTDPEAATAMKSGTTAGMIIGTASYMSPEQARGKAIDARTDIFSVGVVLYEMLAGRKPFTGENSLDVIGSIVADDPTPLTQIIPTLPREIDRIVNKALRKNLTERYQSATDLLVDLKGCQKRLEFEAELERTGTPEAQTQITKTGAIVQTESRNSIAVLPFANMSTDPENEYFCDGLAEELLNALAKIDDLKVAARTSSFAFKGQNANVSDIGRTLSVKTVLEGSVRKSGDRVRITVQLINAADGYHLWSERYDREMQDIFDVQDEITLAVVDALKVQLLGDEKQALLKRYTNNAEAYQLYLRGRFFFTKRTPDGFKKAIAYFEKAIELDPAYALAFSGIADCYTFLGFYEIVTPAEAVDKVRSAAYKSVELDPNLAESRTSMAIFMILYEWDFRGSIKEFEEAIRINPRYALAHHLHSACLAAMDLTPAALAAESLAAELEPFTAIFSASLGWWHYLGRQYEQAVNQSLRTIEIAPSHFFAHWVLGITYGQTSKYEEAIAELQEADRLSAGSQHVKADMARIYAKMGRHDEARKILNDLRAQSADRYISSVSIANVYVGLGDKERALEFLEKACEERAVRLPYFLPDPCVDELRSDPRFQSIRRRVGLPEKGVATHSTKEGLEAHTVLLKSTETRTDTGIKNHKLGAAIAVLLLIAGIVALVLYLRPRHTSETIESIAVLPFENRSENPDTEYLSDGLADSLIFRLSQLPNLKVSPTSSVMRYKGKETEVPQIAKELKVDAVMSGRVVQRGEDLSISVQLIDSRSEKLIWAEQYDRKMADLLATQREIATTITQKLQLKLAGGETKGITKKYTSNNEAYQLYLKGRFHFARRSREDVFKAVDYFGQAIQLDPSFGLAYARVAEAYNQMPVYPYLSPKEAGPKALAAAKRALEIDPTLSEAHAALGNTLVHYERNWPEAERAFKRAIELDPNSASAHYRYGTEYLMSFGRTDEALAEVRRAIDIEPLDLNMLANLARVYLYGNQPANALEQAKKASELDPNFVVGRFILGMSYNANGHYADTITLTENALKNDPGSQFMLVVRGFAFARAGRRAEAEAVITRFRELSKTGMVNWDFVAAIYCGLGDKEKAFAELEKAFEGREYWLTWLKIDPMMKDLHGDPRFAEMVKRLKLPE